MQKVRAWQFGAPPHHRFYIRFTPNLGFGLPWFGGMRIRWAAHLGLQLCKWVRDRWYVERQLLGSDKVTPVHMRVRLDP